jgi:WhiB family redox-sensing transcriptional regulator
MDYEWSQGALCRGDDPEKWYPGRGGSVRELRAICAQCPVRIPCLEQVMLFTELNGYDEQGFWAGTTVRERRLLREPRRRDGRAV